MNGVLNQIPLIYDLNDDGQVTTDDVQALMEYVTGSRASISNGEHADFNGDGELNTRDVYKFLAMLTENELTGTKQIVSGIGSTNGQQTTGSATTMRMSWGLWFRTPSWRRLIRLPVPVPPPATWGIRCPA